MARWATGVERARGAASRTTRTALGALRSRAAIPIWATLLGGAGLVVGVAAAGGFEAATPAPTPLAVGDTAETAQYAVTVLGAELADEVEEQYLEADPGQRLAVVTVRLENRSQHPISVGGTVDHVNSRLVNSSASLLELAGVDADTSVSSWRPDGSTSQVVLQPRVPTEVQLAWSVPDDSFADGVLQLDVHEPIVSTGQVILSSKAVTWRPGELVARFDVPLERR